jgi:hypothetical protein
VIFALAFALVGVTASDTTITLAAVNRDVTGDGIPELLTLVGVGPSVDSLNLTFTITAAGQTIYSARLHPISRRTYERRIQPYLRWTYEAWLKDRGASFFDTRKFATPIQWVAELRRSARHHVDLIPSVIGRDGGFARDSIRSAAIWSDIQRAGVTIFSYSPGGDVTSAIAWHPRTNRFYQLIECC